MTNKQKADIIAFIHLFWILFGLVSLPLLFIIPEWNKIVLIFTGVTIFSWIVFRGCWFLQLENRLRKQHSPKSAFEEESFIQHYLKRYLNINCFRSTVRSVIYTYIGLLVGISLVKLLIFR